MFTVLAAVSPSPQRAEAELLECFTLSRRSASQSSDVSETQREDESGVKIKQGLLTGQKKKSPHFTNL